MTPEYRNLCGPIVRKSRVRLGLSQEQLAAKCQRMGWDISRDIVARIEGQVRWVADYELSLLGHVLGISPTDLIPPFKAALKNASYL